MENLQIIERVNKEIQLWKNIQAKKGRKVHISKNAVEFIVEIIDNIIKDPSKYWKLDDEYNNSFQALAIAKIPEALDFSIYYNRRIRNINFLEEELTISTWEIWHSLSRILIRFCFIPEKDM